MQSRPLTIKLQQFILFFLCLGFLAGCESRSPLELKNFDSEVWQSDRNGCNLLRGEFVNSLMDQRNVFIGAKQQRVIKTLGRPDRVELDPRMKRTHYYFVQPGTNCEDKEEDKLFKAIAVEYEPIHRKVKSVSIARLK